MAELFDFGEALRRVKAGARIGRLGWNGKNMYVFLAQPTEFAVSVSLAAAPEANSGSRPCLTMRDAQGKLVFGWLASQTDMLAEDWHVVSEPGMTTEALKSPRG